MSTWRIETAKNSEKNSEQVIEKMAAAARALGWPEQIVDAARAQMQSITKMQIQTMDHMMDAWEEQIKSPNPMTGKIIERPRVEITPYRYPRVRYLALVDGRMAATSLDRASPPLSEAL